MKLVRCEDRLALMLADAGSGHKRKRQALPERLWLAGRRIASRPSRPTGITMLNVLCEREL
jgi:hypothetical protein